MSSHLPNLDPHQHAADMQATKDVKLNADIVEYFADHLDAYPSALFMVATVLSNAIKSPTNGVSEHHALMEIYNTVCNYVRTDDPMSLPLVRR